VYCNGCGQKLCALCSKPHRMIPGGAHQVVSFGSDVKQDLIKLKGSFCTAHPGNRLEIHCTTCHENICLTCHAMKHKKHNCKDILDIHKTFSQILSRDVEQVATKESYFLEKLRRIVLEQKNFDDGVDRVEKELRVAANELKRHIDETVNQLAGILSDEKMAALKVTSAKKSDLEFALAASQSFTTYSCELLGNGKPSDVTQAFNDVHERANELLKRDLETGKCGLPDLGVSVNHLYEAMEKVVMEKSTRECSSDVKLC
jgi:tripartite motif-containing protein 45